MGRLAALDQDHQAACRDPVGRLSMLRNVLFQFVSDQIGVRAIAVIGLLAGFGMVFTGFGCAGLGAIGGGALGGECMLDSDCSSDLICAYQFCHIPCTETRDCDVAGGEECLIGHEVDKGPYNYCAIPIACARDVECGDSRVCDGGKCRDACVRDDHCLGDQQCFHGGCRNVAEPDVPWGAPAGIGEPCTIPSDCASKNCNAVCIGCAEDFDCGGTRTCDPVALDGTGMCSGGSAKLSAKVTPIDVGAAFVRDAVPDSEGKYVYFLAYSSVARIGPDGAVCTIFSAPGFNPTRIAISSDDSMLFVNSQWPYDNNEPHGISTIALFDSTTCVANIPQMISWTAASYRARSLVVEARAKGDAITFITDGKLLAGSVDSGFLWMMGIPKNSEIAVGGGRTLLLPRMNQLAEIYTNASTSVLAAHIDLNDLGDGSELHRGMALNFTSDTIYVPDYGYGQETVVAIDIAQPWQTKRYGIDGSVGVDAQSSRNIHRAQNKNVFSWVTGEGKLYLFEPQ